MADLDRMTQRNAALVEETSAAARSLAGESDHLGGLVGGFELGSAGYAPVRRMAA